MRFTKIDPHQAQINRLRKQQAEFKWQVCFCWLPRRIDEGTVVWLERAARRRTMMDTEYMKIIGRLVWMKAKYQYGPITNALMQPGVAENDGASYTQAQAGSIAVQGGSIAALGQNSQSLQLQRAANVSGAAQGRLNTPPPQSGP